MYLPDQHHEHKKPDSEDADKDEDESDVWLDENEREMDGALESRSWNGVVMSVVNLVFEVERNLGRLI